MVNRNDTEDTLQYPRLVDPNDPGFNIDLDGNFGDLSIDSDLDSETDDSASNDTDLDDPQTSSPILNTLITAFQSEFIKQPKSTQVILTREAKEIYDSYGQHGSQARLAVAVMNFLEGGDIVARPAGVDTKKDRTGEAEAKTSSMFKGYDQPMETMKLAFDPLPEIGNNEARQSRQRNTLIQRDLVHGKQASDRDARDDQPRFGSSFDKKVPQQILSSLADRRAVNNTSGNPNTVGRMFATSESGDAMDVDNPRPSQRRSRFDFSNILRRSRPSNQNSVNNSTGVGPMTLSRPQQPIPHPGLPSASFTFPTPPTTPIKASNMTETSAQAHKYSCTTDPETHDLLLDTVNPPFRFDPLCDLHPNTLHIPNAQTSRHIPSSINTPLTHIRRLHTTRATRHLELLTIKYTVGRPLGSPPPPLALFRLATSAIPTLKLHGTFTPTHDDPLSLSPSARALFKDVYDNVCPGGVNFVEAECLARIVGTDQDSVEVWWEARNMLMRDVWMLRIWEWARAKEADADRDGPGE